MAAATGSARGRAGDPAVLARVALARRRDRAPACASPAPASAPAPARSADRSQGARPAPCPRPRSRAAGRSSVRPGRLGIDVVGRDRRDAAPVVDAGREQAVERVGIEVRRRLDAHLRRRTRGARARSSRDGPRATAPARRAIAVPGLARKFWTMISCRWPCSRVQRAQREQRLDALAPGLADADQDAAGERHAQLAGRADRLEPHRGTLVRAAVVRPAALAQPLRGRLQHQPGRDRDRAQRARDRPGVITPGLTCGSSPVASLHPLRDLGEIVDRGRVTRAPPAPRAPRGSGARAGRRA